MKISRQELLENLKKINFLQISNDEKICFLILEENLQIFFLSNFSKSFFTTQEIIENLELNKLENSKNSLLEILRIYQVPQNCAYILVLKSNIPIEKNFNQIKEKKFVKIFFYKK